MTEQELLYAIAHAKRQYETMQAMGAGSEFLAPISAQATEYRQQLASMGRSDLANEVGYFTADADKAMEIFNREFEEEYGDEATYTVNPNGTITVHTYSQPSWDSGSGAISEDLGKLFDDEQLSVLEEMFQGISDIPSYLSDIMEQIAHLGNTLPSQFIDFLIPQIEAIPDTVSTHFDSWSQSLVQQVNSLTGNLADWIQNDMTDTIDDVVDTVDSVKPYLSQMYQALKTDLQQSNIPLVGLMGNALQTIEDIVMGEKTITEVMYDLVLGGMRQITESMLDTFSLFVPLFAQYWELFKGQVEDWASIDLEGLIGMLQEYQTKVVNSMLEEVP